MEGCGAQRRHRHRVLARPRYATGGERAIAVAIVLLCSTFGAVDALGGQPTGPARPTAQKCGPLTRADLSAVYAIAQEKLEAVLPTVLETGQLPSITDKATGQWKLTAPNSWTSGFYPGMLWQMAAASRFSSCRAAATSVLRFLESQKFNSKMHDIGFMMFLSYGLGYQQTGTAAWKNTVVTSAHSLATRFVPKVNAIRSWDNKKDRPFNNGVWVIVDNMMNLELLLWAAKATKNSTLYDIAVRHAETTTRSHVRPYCAGVSHVVIFDPATGRILRKLPNWSTGTVQDRLNLPQDIVWARGLAWAIYGFTMTYRYTSDTRFLQTARCLADFFVAKLPSSDIPPYAFCSSQEQQISLCQGQDVSAAVIAASGLFELSVHTAKASYREVAEAILSAVVRSKQYFPRPGSCASLVQTPNTLDSAPATSWGDYYFLEALTRYQTYSTVC